MSSRAAKLVTAGNVEDHLVQAAESGGSSKRWSNVWTGKALYKNSMRCAVRHRGVVQHIDAFLSPH
jgi:hypothetical protein